MWQDIESLIPPVVMATIFIAVMITAFRATDGARRGSGRSHTEEDEPEEHKH